MTYQRDTGRSAQSLNSELSWSVTRLSAEMEQHIVVKSMNFRHTRVQVLTRYLKDSVFLNLL